MKVAGAIFHRNTMAGGKSHVYRLVYGYCAALFPILSVLILARAIRSLLRVPHTPEVWAQLSPAERQRRAR